MWSNTAYLKTKIQTSKANAIRRNEILGLIQTGVLLKSIYMNWPPKPK